MKICMEGRPVRTLLLAAALGYAGWAWLHYSPVLWFMRDGATGTTDANPEQAYRTARLALDRFGGLPPDARLVQDGSWIETTTSAPRTTRLDGYWFQWANSSAPAASVYFPPSQLLTALIAGFTNATSCVSMP